MNEQTIDLTCHRDLPLDEHPQEMYDRHHIIKLETITGRDFYVWDPSGSPQEFYDITWTEDRSGAYRYSDTEYGKESRDADLIKAEQSMESRGVHGRVKFCVIN